MRQIAIIIMIILPLLGSLNMNYSRDDDGRNIAHVLAKPIVYRTYQKNNVFANDIKQEVFWVRATTKMNFSVEGGNLIDGTMYAGYGKELTFYVQALDSDGLEHINITVNGTLWVRIIYNPVSDGWYMKCFYWAGKTLGLIDWYSSSYSIHARIILTLKPPVNEGAYTFEAITFDVTGNTTTFPLENADCVIFDYTKPTIQIVEVEAVNTLDNHTKDMDHVDPSDRVLVIVNASDNYCLRQLFVSYTQNGIDWHNKNMSWNGTYYITYIPPQPPGNITYKICAVDDASNNATVYRWYLVVDPYPPILHNISFTSDHGLYVCEDINLLVTIVENANSSIATVNCSIYTSNDNTTWSYTGSAIFELIDHVDMAIEDTVDGELEIWNNATVWKLAMRFGYWTYVKINVFIYDIGGHKVKKTLYLEIRKRPVEIIVDNITTRYGDWTNVDVGILDGLNGSYVSLYFELYVDDELVYYGWSNATGNTTIRIRFLRVGNHTMIISVLETMQYASNCEGVKITVLRETIRINAVFNAVQIDDTFEAKIAILDDENNLAYGCSISIYVYVNETWIAITQNMMDNPFLGTLTVPISLPNGVYLVMITVDGGENYLDLNYTEYIEVARTELTVVYYPENITLGETLTATFTIHDPDGIEEVIVKAYDPYGMEHITDYTLSEALGGLRVDVNFYLSVHEYAGEWQLWILAVDKVGTETIFRRTFNVSDVELILIVRSPKNNTMNRDGVVVFSLEVIYYGVGYATDNDAVVIASDVNSGTMVTLHFNGDTGVFEGTLTLSPGNHTILIKAYDGVRSARVFIVIHIIGEKEFGLPSYMLGFSIGGMLLLAGFFVGRKIRRGDAVGESGES